MQTYTHMQRCVYVCVHVYVCVPTWVCVYIAHNITVTEKGFGTQPVNPQGLVAKGRKRNKAKNAFDLRWKPRSYKYFNLETDNVIRAPIPPSAQNAHSQAPDIKNLQTQISSLESQLPPSVAGNVAWHAAWSCAEAVKINVSICGPSKHLSSYQLRDVQFLGPFIIRTRQLPAIQKSH